MFSNHLLSLAIWLPIAAGLLVLATGCDRRAPLARILAFVGALASFLVTLPLFTQFDRLSGGFQFAEFYAWQSDRSFASEMRVIAAHIFAAVWVRTSLIMFGFTSFQPQGMRALESPRGML